MTDSTTDVRAAAPIDANLVFADRTAAGPVRGAFSHAPLGRAGLVRLALLTGLAFTLSGCLQEIGAISYYLQPRRMQKPEFELTAERLAILVETARPEQDNPVFTQAFHENIEKIFRREKLKTRLVSFEQTYQLRQENSDFRRWSVQRVGRTLEAEQVLYVRLDTLRLREDSGSPLVTPQADVRLSVVDVGSPAEHARLWPKNTEVRELLIKRSPQEYVNTDQLDREAAKLGRETAKKVAEFFHEVDLEAPREYEE